MSLMCRLDLIHGFCLYVCFLYACIHICYSTYLYTFIYICTCSGGGVIEEYNSCHIFHM